MVYHYLSNFFNLCMKLIDYSFTNYAIRNNFHIGHIYYDPRHTYQFNNINDEWKNT